MIKILVAVLIGGFVGYLTGWWRGWVVGSDEMAEFEESRREKSNR